VERWGCVASPVMICASASRTAETVTLNIAPIRDAVSGLVSKPTEDLR
jgi:hypothetical protein